MTSESGGLGLYVYGVVGAEVAIPGGLRGIDPAGSVSALTDGSIAALISEVPLAEFESEQLEQRLEDIEWLERTALAHEHVLEQVGSGVTLVPMRLCSIFRTEEGLRRMLSEQQETLTAALERLAGKREWGVKAFAHADAGTASEAAGVSASGTDYMRARLRERQEAQASVERRQRACQAIHDRLGELSSDHLGLPPQPRELTGRSEEMVLNGVYLVPDGEAENFTDQVRALQQESVDSGLELVLTGPWPPYNFVAGTLGRPE